MNLNNLTNEIERHIHRLLLQARNEGILLRRNDLASKLRCAPSQISYVLATRFTSDRGYIVESRRGSGGYVRICRISSCPSLSAALEAKVGKEIDVARMVLLLQELRVEGRLTFREMEIIRVILGDGYISLSDGTRAALLKILIATLGPGMPRY